MHSWLCGSSGNRGIKYQGINICVNSPAQFKHRIYDRASARQERRRLHWVLGQEAKEGLDNINQLQVVLMYHHNHQNYEGTIYTNNSNSTNKSYNKTSCR